MNIVWWVVAVLWLAGMFVYGQSLRRAAAKFPMSDTMRRLAVVALALVWPIALLYGGALILLERIGRSDPDTPKP